MIVLGMNKTYSTCIIPETSEGLLFSLQSDKFLYHCWKSKNKFVVIKESNDFSKVVPNQIMNFKESELKRYLYVVAAKLKNLDELLFFNDTLWKWYFEN
jgi:hypothetical protein